LTTTAPGSHHHAADVNTPQVVPTTWRNPGPLQLASDTNSERAILRVARRS
jgi:hypothetical protein